LTRYLLDTHALIWWWTDDARLSGPSRDVIERHVAAVRVSVGSIWEIAIKSAAGRLPEIVDFRGEYPGLIAANGFQVMPIDDGLALAAAYLPGQHRDPFDRVIAAQALAGNMTVITRDPEIAAFGCEVLW